MNIGTRVFAVSAPTVWNMPHYSVRSVENIAKLQCHLKIPL